MKKIISLVMFLAAITMPAKAQIDYGVKGGLNLTSMSLDAKVVDSSNQMGFFLGPTVSAAVSAFSALSVCSAWLAFKDLPAFRDLFEASPVFSKAAASPFTVSSAARA